MVTSFVKSQFLYKTGEKLTGLPRGLIVWTNGAWIIKIQVTAMVKITVEMANGE